MLEFENEVIKQVQGYLSLFGENPYIQATIVIVLFFIFAKLTDWFITRGVTRVTRKTRSTLDDRLIALLHRPIFLTVALLGLLIAAALVAPDSVRRIVENLIASIIVFLWVVFGVRAATIIIGSLTQDTVRFKAIQPATRPLFETSAKLILISLGIYFVLISWGVDPVGWLATAGIAAVAVGLAAQETLGNLFAGLSILADAPYKLGDYVVLEGNERGKVTKIGLRSTRILTRDDLEVTIPNSIIARSKIVNETTGRWVKQRLRIGVGVAYGSDADLVKEVLLGAVKSIDEVCTDPEPWVQFRNFGDSSLDFEIRCWIDDPARRGRITNAINSAIYRFLNENHIEIPFPQRDLYIKELPEGLISKK